MITNITNIPITRRHWNYRALSLCWNFVLANMSFNNNQKFNWTFRFGLVFLCVFFHLSSTVYLTCFVHIYACLLWSCVWFSNCSMFVRSSCWFFSFLFLFCIKFPTTEFLQMSVFVQFPFESPQIHFQFDFGRFRCNYCWCFFFRLNHSGWSLCFRLNFWSVWLIQTIPDFMFSFFPFFLFIFFFFFVSMYKLLMCDYFLRFHPVF